MSELEPGNVFGQDGLWVAAWWTTGKGQPSGRDGYLVGEKYATWTVRDGSVTSASGAPRVTVERVDGPGHGHGSVGGFATERLHGGTVIAHWWPTVVDFSDHGCWQVTETTDDDSITYIVQI